MHRHHADIATIVEAISDLLDTQCQCANEEGALASISSYAHGSSDSAIMRSNPEHSCRGWLDKHDVLNKMSLTALRMSLKGTRR
jgi:hypothetical protein